MQASAWGPFCYTTTTAPKTSGGFAKAGIIHDFGGKILIYDLLLTMAVYQLIGSYQLSNAPCLGEAAFWLVRLIAVEYL